MGRRSVLVLIVVSLIFAIGLLMVFNTSAAEIMDKGMAMSTHQAVLRQLLYAVMGVGLGMVLWFIGYEGVLKTSFPVLCFLTLLLVLVFVPGLGQARNGAHRWLGVGAQTFQPSEFVKVWLPLFAIYYLREERGFLSFARLACLCAIPMILILMEPDNGTCFILGLTLLVVFLVTGVKARYWLLPVVVLAGIGVVCAFQLPYVTQRLKVYMNPELDLRGRGHQPYQAKIAAGSGGVFGRGIGQSMQKLAYLPEAQNDYIAAIYAEESGFVGVVSLIFLYMLFAALGFSVAMHAQDREGFCLAITLTVLIAMQAFLNLGVVSGLMPSKGLNLPFFSQGGSSLMANIFALTLLLNIDRSRPCLAK